MIRRILVFATLTVVLVGLVLGGLFFWFYSTATVGNVGDLEFANELHIPPELPFQTDESGRKAFNLRYEAGTREFLPAKITKTIGLNGPFLGPTLRASRGDEVVVHVENGLDESTTLHWHGMHLPAVMDGGPHQPIAPDTTWSPTWTIDQPAATLWFHPHLHHSTEDHVYRGAAGFFLIDDDVMEALELPDSYGIDDIPVIVQDRAFHDDGSFSKRRPSLSNGGVLGDQILVNGTYDPYFEATTTLLRLRLLNGSVNRIHELGFTDGREFAAIATDSGLLERPAAVERVQLSPGERVEIVVTLTPGEEIMLRSFGADLGMDFFTNRMNGGDDTFDILRINAAETLAESPPLPQTLAHIAAPDVNDATVTRSFRVSGNSINDRKFDPARIDEVAEIGSVEIWEVEGGGGGPHTFHVHDQRFLIIDVDGEAPEPLLGGWKDSIHLQPNKTYRLLMQFTDYTDGTNPYVFHCHILRHEDQGMMGQFIVVEEGETRSR